MVWIARTVATLVCLLLVSSSGLVFAQSTRPPLTPPPRTTTSSSTAITGSPALTGPAVDRAYAEREARHPEAADFRGGDSFGVYIGGSAGLVVVILLVLLLLR